MRDLPEAVGKREPTTLQLIAQKVGVSNRIKAAIPCFSGSNGYPVTLVVLAVEVVRSAQSALSQSALCSC